MIIVTVTGPSMAEALRQIRHVGRDADMIELRLDLVRCTDLHSLFSSARRPVIATCRPRREGGGFAGSERTRSEILRVALGLGARMVDLELSAGERFFGAVMEGRSREGMIVSRHFMTPGVPDTRAVYREMRRAGAGCLKLAYVAGAIQDIRHAARFLELARADRQRAIAIAMGEEGELTRILYRRLGGWATYASAGVGQEGAPGQISARELRRVYRSHRLNRRTRVFGVLGYPLAQSKGVEVHNSLFGSRNAVYCRLQARELRSFMRHVSPLLAGFSVTIPHKQSIIRYVDTLTHDARAIGAVNTVIRRGGQLLGLNTDAGAALDAIEQVVCARGMRMLVLGSGGAARAIAYEARRRGARLLVCARSPGAARTFARDFSAEIVSRQDLSRDRFDIVVNATPVGMVPDTDLTPLSPRLLRGKVVFDAVYNPPLTRLLRDALAGGGKIVPGTEMYVRQAARQSALYTGFRPDLAVLRRIMNRHLSAPTATGKR